MATKVEKLTRPLKNKRIILTQSLDQCIKLEKILFNEESDVIKIPAIAFESPAHREPLIDAIANLSTYHLLVLTSQTSADFFAKLLIEAQIELPEGIEIAAVGEETKFSIEQHGWHVKYIPFQCKNSNQLADYLIEHVALAGKKVLFPRSSLSVSQLPQKLKNHRAWVDDVVLYETRSNLESKEIFDQVVGQPVDWILFSSPSAVTSFFAFGETDEVLSWIFNLGINVGSLGSTTTSALLEMSVPVSVQAPIPSARLLIETIKDFESFESF